MQTESSGEDDHLMMNQTPQRDLIFQISSFPNSDPQHDTAVHGPTVGLTNLLDSVPAGIWLQSTHLIFPIW